MLPPCSVSETFLDLFYHEMVDVQLGNSNTLNLFILKIQNNKFCFNELTNEIYDIIISYALSRKSLSDYHDSLGGKKYKAAISRLRNHSSNEGELGEILLYSFLESHLQAPKILSKLEIKTANNDYVKGADGVHILKIDDENFQLIFGESKLNSDLAKGISESFRSITKFINEKNKKIGFEIGLVNSELFKEVCGDTEYEALKSIIIPSARKNITNMDYSFGIFLGYNHAFSNKTKQLSNKEFRSKTRAEIRQTVTQSLESIKKQISKENLGGYNYYIYVVPFSELEVQRKKIIGEL